jgi:hypothetical protein
MHLKNVSVPNVIAINENNNSIYNEKKERKKSSRLENYYNK